MKDFRSRWSMNRRQGCTRRLQPHSAAGVGSSDDCSAGRDGAEDFGVSAGIDASAGLDVAIDLGVSTGVDGPTSVEVTLNG